MFLRISVKTREGGKKIKRGMKIFLIIIGIIAILGYIFFIVDYNNDNKVATIKAIIVKVNERNLLVQGLENETLYSIGTTNFPNIKLKKGQEILIYFDGNIMETYPERLGNIGKIEIIEEESNTKISKEILRYCYSSNENVNIDILELTNSRISLTITDTNEYPYQYAHSYKINKKVKNENYIGTGEVIGKNTENTTAGYTRNRCPIYMAISRQNF